MKVPADGATQVLIDAVGLAIWSMYRFNPALAGAYLDELVSRGFFTVEQGLELMDVMRTRASARTTQGEG